MNHKKKQTSSTASLKSLWLQSQIVHNFQHKVFHSAKINVRLKKFKKHLKLETEIKSKNKYFIKSQILYVF